MTLEELGRLQAAFGAQLAGEPDPAALAPWLGNSRPAADGVGRYALALRQHRQRSLELVYPVLRALGGAPWFATLARDYGMAHPSRSPDLGRFGAQLPDFLAHWPHAAAHRYFADVARLEWLLHEAHGAADAVALTPAAARDAGAALGGWRLRLHPAAAIHRSAWRTAAIWLAHAAPAQHVRHALPACVEGATVALVYRAGWVPTVRETGAAEAAALDVLAGAASFGATLGDALGAALAADDGADPAALFTRWLADGLLVGC